MLHYLPGCDVKKNHRESITLLEQYMLKQEATIEKCCRTHTKICENDDTIVNNCTLCQMILEETHPNNKNISIYEYVLEDPNFPWVDHHKEKITIQDCWRTKDHIHLQKAIREYLIKMNFEIIEINENYKNSSFCGVWLNNQPNQEFVELAPVTFYQKVKDHIHLLSSDEQILKMKKWAQQYTTSKVVVYCNGCEKGLKLGHANVVHMVELISEGLKQL